MKQQIVCISILQSSKILVAIYVLFGFIYTLIGIPMVLFGEGGMKIVGIFYLFGPVFMGLFGFLFFAFFAWIYNLLASALGGFEFEVKTIE
ncbi:hypothetical protein Pan241w_37850 [Gimesia alba]|uniref:DUF3566 domain-containing protein n=1 Tax=Gimesia alba TaxID=2527973 RepID=A0A517RIJ6_9PLAN|nr:hypothetical protein [Gimesia alba]QDT43683.1 hypothetical protein Pan241w_37850 [Gimesia alba]